MGSKDDLQEVEDDATPSKTRHQERGDQASSACQSDECLLYASWQGRDCAHARMDVKACLVTHAMAMMCPVLMTKREQAQALK